MPGLSGIREATRRVVCSSNLRQQGLGLAMYADDNKGALAPSNYSSASRATSTSGSGPTSGLGVVDNSSQQTVLARDGDSNSWDGLGWLFTGEYLPASGVFYCPSHHGDYPFRVEAPLWITPTGEIVTNYQYRGGDSFGSALFSDQTALITDAMRTVDEFNHVVGANVLRRDLTVSWYADKGGLILQSLPNSVQQLDAGSRVDDAWKRLDSSNNPTSSAQ